MDFVGFDSELRFRYSLYEMEAADAWVRVNLRSSDYDRSLADGTSLQTLYASACT